MEKRSGKTFQVLWLVAGNLCSLLFGLGSMAVLGRFFTPEQYGTYRQVLYVYHTLLLLFSLGMPRAYSYFLVRMSVEEGAAFVAKMRRLFFGLGGAMAVLLYGGADAVAQAMGNTELAPALRIFAPTPLLLMPVLGIESLLVALDRTRLNVLYVLVNRLTTAVGVLLPVTVWNMGVEGAVGGFVAAGVLNFGVGTLVERLPFRHVGRRPTRVSVREILAFSLPLFTAGVCGFVIVSVSPFFIGRYLGAAQFALYVNGYVELPVAAWIVGATSTVLLPLFSRMQHDGRSGFEMVGVWRGVIVKSAKIIYPLSLFCCVFATPIMECVYGTAYRDAGLFLQIITPVNLLRVAPFSPVLFALGRGGDFSRAHFVTALVLIAAEAICVRWFPSTAAIAAIQTLCTAGCLLGCLAAVRAAVGVGWRQLLPATALSKLLVLSLVASGASRFIMGSVGGWGGLIGAFFLASAFYAFLCALCGIGYADLLRPLLPAGRVAAVVRRCRIGSMKK